MIRFKISGEGNIVGVDNGLQTSDESFQASYRKAFNGLCLAVIRSAERAGQITLEAMSDGLKGSSIVIDSK
jgi:beta-galactosidase